MYHSIEIMINFQLRILRHIPMLGMNLKSSSFGIHEIEVEHCTLSLKNH